MTTRVRWASIALAMMVALGLRVVPSFELVFSPAGVAFQEGDAWFHVRTTQNLLAHFPWRSGSDPYMAFPEGQNIPTGPAWDLLIAAVAWIAGLGSPGTALTEHIAAWLPALLGTMFPLVVYCVGTRLFDRATGLFAAWWIAVIPGAFLWMTHLGLADHHALESLLAFAVLGCCVAALEASGPARHQWSLATGLALGLFLATRPAGIFVLAILASAAVLHAAIASILLRAVPIAVLIFLPVTGVQWSVYTWVALAATFGVACVVLGVGRLSQRRGWPARAELTARLAAGFAIVAVILLARPDIMRTLVDEITGYIAANDIASSVQELRPLLQSSGSPPLSILFEQLGTAWLVSLPALAAVLWMAMRRRRPAWTLVALWGAVMVTGLFLQVRMIMYAVPPLAILAGLACARLIRSLAGTRRIVAASALAAAILATNLPFGIPQVRIDSSPTADWRQAMQWIRENTPEPMGDASAWNAYYPRVKEGSRIAYPPSAYGIAVWWDYGYWLQYLAHRIPSTNGTQIHAVEVARFLTEPDSRSAVEQMRALGTKYVAASPAFPLLNEKSSFPAMIQVAGRRQDSYYRRLVDKEHNRLRPVTVLLPEYYRAPAVHLYLHNGEATEGQDAWLFETRQERDADGKAVEAYFFSVRFHSEKDARAYMAQFPSRHFLLACADPGRSCVDLDPIPGIRQVYTTDPQPISRSRLVRAVKVFEVQAP